MGSVTDLPIRQSTSPTSYDPPEPVPPVPPSLFQWLKAGFGFAVGVWLAALVLFLPTVFLSLWWSSVWFRAMAMVLGRR